MYVPVSAALHCSDAPYGHVSHLLVDLAGMRLTHVATVEPGVWPVERLIPVALVDSSTPRAIVLTCTREALERMIARAELDARSGQGDYGSSSLHDLRWSLVFPEQTSLAVPRELIPLGDVSLHSYSRVLASDGPAGHVQGLLIEPGTATITHLVVRQGHRLNRHDVKIPASGIERFEADNVHLRLTKEAAAASEAVSGD
jgi:hypothetical protein